MRNLFSLVSLFAICAFVPNKNNAPNAPKIPKFKVIPKDSITPNLPKNTEDAEFLVEVQNPNNMPSKELDLTKAKLAIALDSIEALNYRNKTLKYQLKKCNETK